MDISTVPKELAAAEKLVVRRWLERQMATEELATNTTMPDVCKRFVVYLGGVPHRLENGYWQEHSQWRMYVGHYNPDYPHIPSRLDRLGVLAVIAGQAGLWDELAGRFGETAGRILLGTWNSVFGGVVQTQRPAVQLAMTAEHQQFAVKYTGDEAWYLPNGEPVDAADWPVKVAA